MRIGFCILLLLEFFCSCNGGVCLPESKYGETMNCNIKQVKFTVPDDMLELNTYSTTFAWKNDSVTRVLGYNRFSHALDVLDFNKEKVLYSISLHREGPDGVPGRICGIFSFSEDSIWVYDEIGMYLLDGNGHVKHKLHLPERENVEIRANYAMNTSRFIYNKEHRSLLYLAYRKNLWVIEEYQIDVDRVIKTYPLQYSLCNSKNHKFYGNMKAPNVTFASKSVVFNYPYESTVYVLDTLTSQIKMFGGNSHNTMNIAKECASVADYSEWERHFIVNPHFYEVSYLSDLNLFVRLHLGESDYDSSKSMPDMILEKTLYVMLFDEKFNVVGEIELPHFRYSYFTGWCALSDALLLFVDESTPDRMDNEELLLDLLLPYKSQKKKF